MMTTNAQKVNDANNEISHDEVSMYNENIF